MQLVQVDPHFFKETVCGKVMQLTAWMLCCSTLLVSASVHGLNLEGRWQSWKEEHGKLFSSEKEEMERLKIWMKNVAIIEEHNVQNHSFTLRMNQFGDMVGLMLPIYNFLFAVQPCM